VARKVLTANLVYQTSRVSTQAATVFRKIKLSRKKHQNRTFLGLVLNLFKTFFCAIYKRFIFEIVVPNYFSNYKY
jgi:hypothetical protein